MSEAKKKEQEEKKRRVARARNIGDLVSRKNDEEAALILMHGTPWLSEEPERLTKSYGSSAAPMSLAFSRGTIAHLELMASYGASVADMLFDEKAKENVARSLIFALWSEDRDGKKKAFFIREILKADETGKCNLSDVREILRESSMDKNESLFAEIEEEALSGTGASTECRRKHRL